MGISIREVECQLNAKLFLDEYPPWDIEGPHCPIILQSMFLHAAREGQKEAEIHPPRLLAKLIQARSQRKLVCHMAGGLSDLPERNQGLIPWGISAKEVTQPTAMQAPSKRGSYSEHLVLTDEPVAKVGGATPTGRRSITVWLPPLTSHSANEKVGPGLMRGEADMMRPSRRDRKAHKQALEATHWLELHIERLSQGVVNIQCQCPCSQSDSCQQSKSLDRWDRSPSWCKPERHVTFHEPEVEPFSGRVPHQEPRGHLPQAQMRRGGEGLLLARRREIPCPQEMLVAYPDVENRMGDPSEPSIGNYEVWLNWWACQLDTPHWWRELVAIPEMEDPNRLARKIQALFPDSGS